LLRRYQAALTMQGDAVRGKAVFKKTCAACHLAEGQGHAIGPNLAAMKNRGPEAILANVLIPNAEVNPQYVTYAVQTKDGRTLSGVVAEESAAGITLLRAENARDSILRIDIEEMRSTGLSLMPEGVEKDIDLQGMADLLEYLKTLE
jgi:putative heme-binding domain-containing protein